MNKEISNKINKLVSRLEKLDISLSLALNYPWIYLIDVNNRRVTEKYYSEHNFTVALANQPQWLDLRRTFKIIREYL